MAIKGNQETITLDGLVHTLDDRDRVAAQIVQESANVFSNNSTIQYTTVASGANDAVSLTVANNAGRVTWVPDVTADRVYTLPTPEAGLHIHVVGAGALAADGHDVTFTVASANNQFFHGGLLHFDTDEASTGGFASIWGNGSSNDTIKVTLPELFDIHFVGKSSTVWYVYGWAASVTDTTIADS